MLLFGLGFFVGGLIGVFMMCLLIAGKAGGK